MHIFVVFLVVFRRTASVILEDAAFDLVVLLDEIFKGSGILLLLLYFLLLAAGAALLLLCAPLFGLALLLLCGFRMIKMLWRIGMVRFCAILSLFGRRRTMSIESTVASTR